METFSALLAFVRGIHRSPVNSPHKASDAELSCFLWSKRLMRLVIWDDIAPIMTSTLWLCNPIGNHHVGVTILTFQQSQDFTRSPTKTPNWIMKRPLMKFPWEFATHTHPQLMFVISNEGLFLFPLELLWPLVFNNSMTHLTSGSYSLLSLTRYQVNHVVWKKITNLVSSLAFIYKKDDSVKFNYNALGAINCTREGQIEINYIGRFNRTLFCLQFDRYCCVLPRNLILKFINDI